MGAIYGLGAGLIAWLLLAYGLGWLNEAVVNLAGLYGSDFGLEGVPAGDALSLVIGAVLLVTSAPGWLSHGTSASLRQDKSPFNTIA